MIYGCTEEVLLPISYLFFVLPVFTCQIQIAYFRLGTFFRQLFKYIHFSVNLEMSAFIFKASSVCNFY